jgi:hypothetical protein
VKYSLTDYKPIRDVLVDKALQLFFLTMRTINTEEVNCIDFIQVYHSLPDSESL